MRRLLRWPIALGALFFIHAGALAEESSAAQELRELRQTVAQQTKQIELLAEQIGRLTRAMQTQKAPEEPVPSPTVETPRAPAESAASLAPKAEMVPMGEAAPKAEAGPETEPVAGAKHTVAKGETLTSIAKQYNIPLADLKNANKIENDRKLQIGQILVVPTAKPPETPDKKDNP